MIRTERTSAQVAERSSILCADPAEVWSAVKTNEGVNEELAPWVRMTYPPEARVIEDAPLGALARPIVAALLTSRHRVLRRRYPSESVSARRTAPAPRRRSP